MKVGIHYGPIQYSRRKLYGGAESIIGSNELEGNAPLILCMEGMFRALGIEYVTVDDFRGDEPGVDWIGGYFNDQNVDGVISIRWNKGKVIAAGHEYRYDESTQGGEQFARRLELMHQDLNPKSRRRSKDGCKAIRNDDSHDSILLHGVNCPAVVARFIYCTHPHDWLHFMENMEDYASMFVMGTVHSLEI